MKKIILFIATIISGLYLINFISAISMTKNTGDILDNSTWWSLASITDKVGISGNDLKVNGKIYVSGKLCDDNGNCLGECGDGEIWDNDAMSCVKDSIIDKPTCEGADWIWVDKNNDVYIGANKGDGFCIFPRYGDFSDAVDGTGGVSWNGWGSYAGNHYLQGWSHINIDDSGTVYSNLGQTRDLIHVVDDNTLYSCKALGTASSDYFGSDTIAGRMKWLASIKNNYTEAQAIDWVINITTGNPLIGGSGSTGYKHAIPALYVADCIDGVKNLGTDMNYIHRDNSIEEVTYNEYNIDVSVNTETIALTNVTYQNRQKYLTAWTQKSGSHLPSAFSFIDNGTPGGCLGDGCISNNLTGTGRGEYQVACEANLLIDGNDANDNEYISLSAIGNIDGYRRGANVRIIGRDSCAIQTYTHTGDRNSHGATRFVVRP